jgi:hypothetical protein
MWIYQIDEKKNTSKFLYEVELSDKNRYGPKSHDATNKCWAVYG